MDKIEFRIQPSFEARDHEVRILVNGIDIISNKMMGLDPVDECEQSFFNQPALTGSGELIYARCNCGVVGCGSDLVVVSRDPQTVTWKPKPLPAACFVFDRHQYDDAVNHLMTDFTWETIERTAERLTRDLNFADLSEYGLTFKWASARENKETIAVAFDLDEEGEGKYQVLCYAPWDHQEPRVAAQNMEHILKEPPSLWPNVVYYFQNQYSKSRPPIIAGAGWKAFSFKG